MLLNTSVHALLLSIFFSETGLNKAPAVSVENQLNFLVDSCQILKDAMKNPSWEPPPLSVSNATFIELSKKDDALLFIKLYENFAEYQSAGFSTSSIMSLLVDPAIRSMIQRNVRLADALKTEFGSFLKAHPPAVTHRVLKTLNEFKLGFLVPVIPT